METKRRNWTAVGLGVEILAGLFVMISIWLAIPIAIFGATLIAYGFWPEKAQAVRRRIARKGLPTALLDGPQLKIIFKPKPPWIVRINGSVNFDRKVVTNNSPSIEYVPDTMRAKCIFVRIEATAPLSEVARGCFAYVTNIERRSGRRWVETGFGGALKLRFADVATEKFGPREIRQGVRTFIDVFSTDEIHNRVFVKWESNSIANDALFDAVGTYRITVSVLPETGAGASMELLLDWRGRWDDFSVGMAGKKPKNVTWQEANTKA